MRALQLTGVRTLTPITLPEPRAPGRGETLVAIKAIGICGTDVSAFSGTMPFIEFPRILGHELGVEVLAIADGVQNVRPGDRCSVEPYLNCGQCHACRQGRTNCCESLQVLGVHIDGGMRERMVLPANKLHPRQTLSFESLALTEMLGIGCHAVNRAQVAAGERVLILGAGPIGLSVLEFARLAGADVSIVEINEARRAFVPRTWPAANVLSAPPEEASADVVFDATGHAASMSTALQYVRFTGRVIFVGITREPVLLDDPLFHRRELTLLASRNAVAGDFTHILDLMESGRLNPAAWITHRAPLDDLPAAMREWVRPATGVVKALASVQKSP